jgi:hypothetical protein
VSTSTIRTRTRADRLGDAVSLVILLGLGAFAIGVSFSHTMDFIRAHGQTRGWIVVGTACTVVGLTVQSGMEVWRDRRDRRPAGWPAALLAVGVVVELAANAATAAGSMNRVVAAWPVPVAAAALHLWTRRLSFAAAAEYSSVAPEVVPPALPLDVVDEHQDDVDDDQGDVVDEHQDDVDELPVDLAAYRDPAGGTVKERGAALLKVYPDLSADEIARVVGCTPRYGRMIRQDADTAAAAAEQMPGPLDMLAAAAAEGGRP